MTKKVLIVCATPPGAGNVGEIILRDIVLHVGPEVSTSIAVVPSHYQWRPDQRVPDRSVRLLQSRWLHALRWGPRGVSAAVSLACTMTAFRWDARRIQRAILGIAEEVEPECVLVVLDNAVSIAIAKDLARDFSGSMVTLVWDAPSYLLQQAGFDRISRSLLLRCFAEALARSSRVAVVSETMRDSYRKLTRAPVQLLRHGLPTSDGFVPRKSTDELVIGFAGSMYAEGAWRALLVALDSVNWQVCGRKVRIRAMSSALNLRSTGQALIEYLGFCSVEQTQKYLQDCDITYMPQPFEAHLAEVARYSFPTKLANYLAVGRPVFLHGPRDSELHRFVIANGVGVACDRLAAADILRGLETLTDGAVHARACSAAADAAKRFFDVSVFHASVDELLALGTHAERSATGVKVEAAAVQ